LNHLTREDLLQLVYRALENDEELKKKKIALEETEALLQYSGGDARRLMNVLELITHSDEEPIRVTNESVTNAIQRNIALYDKGGEQHYDVISAFIKSMRGSDPNATVYWLARMLEGGEEIKFIARRMVILAAEDIGLANPNALLMANACAQAIQFVGLPEARIILSEAAIYLALSPKSNTSYMAIEQALSEVQKSGPLPVPLSIRNAPTQLMKQLNYGKDYQYAHDFEGNFVPHEFLPPEVSSRTFYEPGENMPEQKYREMLRKFWEKKYDY
jgi:putative ATPase